MAFVNPATAVTAGAVDSHHLLGLYPSQRFHTGGLGADRPGPIWVLA